MGNVYKLPNQKEPAFTYDGWQRVPIGQYEASFVTWTTFRMGGISKVVWLFSIIESGSYFETIIPMFFNAELKKKTGLRGQFKPPPLGSLIKVFYKLLPDHPKLKRLDRVPLTKLERAVYKITTVDVTHDKQQNPYPEQMIYSKVKDVEVI